MVRNGLHILLDYGLFQYSKASGFKLTAQDGKRLQTFIDDAVKGGQLTTGVWKKRVWLTFVLVSRLGRAWLEHHHKHRTVNWDLTLSRLMSLVLIASLGCRAGDVARSNLYTSGEYPQYCHIRLMLTGHGTAAWGNLEACVTLKHAKSMKDIRNQELVCYLDPLDDPRHQHACPVALILALALRHGLVRGTTIQEVLDHAAQVANRTVEWLFPNHPVISASATEGTIGCRLDKPAQINQVLQSTQMMGVAASILTQVHPHALRLGAAKDVAHLSSATSGSGFATGEVRQALGYSQAAFMQGLTEMYVGAPTRKFFNPKVEQEHVNQWGSGFSDMSAHD